MLVINRKKENMKYFLDTEFIEGFHKPLFGKKRHFIDLISIGIVCEDGREYYAISEEYRFKDADKWVQDNVIAPAYRQALSGDIKNRYSPENFNKHFGKSNAQIRQEIIEFICPYETASEYAGVGSIDSGLEGFLQANPPEFYAYFADYDWVLFCSLFGRMIDLPKGFPMYCNDLKQTLDEKVEGLNWLDGRDIWSNSKRSIETIGKGQHQEDDKPATFEQKLKVIKELDEYPKQKNEHDAIDDAKWNFELYKFLKTL